MAVSYEFKGLSLEALHRIDEAVSAYESSVQLNPQEASAHNNLGNAHKILGHLEAAEAAYREAARLRPDIAQAHMNLALALMDLDQPQEAESCIHKAITNAPQFPEAHYHLARLKHNLGQGKLALAAIDECLRLSRFHQPGLALKALILTDLGRTDEAGELVDLDRFVAQVEIGRSGFTTMAAFNEAMAEHILQHPTLVENPVGASTRGGFHTGNLLEGDKGPFAQFEAELKRAVADLVSGLPMDSRHPFLARTPHSVRLVAQANVLSTQGYLVPHVHPHAWLSTAYYVQIPAFAPGTDGADEQAGWIEFGNPP